MLEIFATNAPDPHHCNINTCFGAFLSIWVHLEPFRHCTTLAAKRAKLVQLMQKFVQRGLVRIFQNELSRSTQYPKLVFWCVSIHLDALELLCCCTKLAAKHAKLVQLMQKFVPRCLVRIFRNKHSRSTTLHPKIMFWCVSFRLGPFGTILLLHET